MDNSESQSIVCGLMAAGTSSRFGHENKLLHRVDSKTLIEHSLDQLCLLNKKNYVILGHEADLVKEQIKNKNCHFLINENFKEGLGTSIKTFIGAIQSTETLGALIHLADLPQVTINDLQHLVSSFLKKPTKIHVSGFSNNFGPPLIIPKNLYSPFMKALEKEGAKSWLKTQELIIIDQPSAQWDIDTKKDLTRI